MTDILLDAWTTTMWRACWQGGLVVLVVWSICRLVPSMPARFQCWFWRLAILKFAVALLCPILLNLPLLPAPSVAIPVPEAGLQVAPDLPVAPKTPASPGGQVEFRPSETIALPSVRGILCFAWIIGVGWSLARLLAAWLGARQLRKQSPDIDCRPLLEQEAIQGKLFGLQSPPKLLASAGDGSPMLIGVLHPAIVIPAKTLGRLSASEQTMVLGHELAHVRRGDLRWRFAARIVRAVFFFHPLVWLIERRLNLLQEIAADQLAIAHQKHDPAGYGKLLVGVVEKFGPSRLIPSMSVGTMEPVESLTRRLIAMKSFRRVSPRLVVISVVLLATTALLGLVPWRLVAAEPQEGEPSPQYFRLDKSKDQAKRKSAVTVIETTLGNKFFSHGDSITIAEVKATSPDLKAGDKVIVKGRYKLSSKPKASLCLFMTATKGSGKGPIHPEQQLDVTKGDGNFELSETMEGDGYLHVTFYSVPEGKPFGGMYFGTAQQMKEIEHWDVKSWYTAK